MHKNSYWQYKQERTIPIKLGWFFVLKAAAFVLESLGLSD